MIIRHLVTFIKHMSVRFIGRISFARKSYRDVVLKARENEVSFARQAFRLIISTYPVSLSYFRRF